MAKVVSISNQSLLDLCLANYGTIESIFDLALANNTKITRAPLPGTAFELPSAIEDITTKSYLFKRNIQFATSSEKVQVLFEQGLFNQGLFI